MQRYNTLPFSIINFLSDLLQLVLAIRLILIFFNANASNAFVAFVYQTTRPLIQLFRSIFAPTVISGYTVDWATIIAMIVYAIIAAVIIRLLGIALSAAAGDTEEDEVVYHGHA